MFPWIKGPGKAPLASAVLQLWVNSISRNEKTKNERAAETIGSKFEIRDLELGIGADEAETRREIAVRRKRKAKRGVW